MDRRYEATYHALEDTHWWFRARRELLARWLKKVPKNAHILEIGCSGGPLLAVLKQQGYRHVSGIDISKPAIDRATARGLENVSVQDAQAPTLPPATFDLIIASDVLEHLQADVHALRHWYALLKPGGRLWIFVPAYQFLWGPHDQANHHYRRYTVTELRQKATEAGFAVSRTGYWNSLLLPPVALVRLVGKLLPKKNHTSDLGQPPNWLNALLFSILQAENACQRWVRFPAGVSAFVQLRRS